MDTTGSEPVKPERCTEECRYADTVFDLGDLRDDRKETGIIDDIQPDELELFNDMESQLPICMQPSIYNRMEYGIACSIEYLEDQFVEHNVADGDEDVATASVFVGKKKSSLSAVFDAAKALSSEIEIFFGDGESILKDGKTEE